MLQKFDDVVVELNTPLGSVFTGRVTTLELRTSDSVIAINPPNQAYLSLTHITQLTLRVGTEFMSFRLKNAAGGLNNGRLTVLAEEIRRERVPNKQ